MWLTYAKWGGLIAVACSPTVSSYCMQKTKSQAFVYSCYSVLRYQGDFLYSRGNFPTCLHPSAPVAPPVLQYVLIAPVCYLLSRSAHIVSTSLARSFTLLLCGWANTVQIGDPDVPLLLWHCWQSSSFYCLLIFFVPLTILVVDAYVLLPRFVQQRLVSAGDRACVSGCSYQRFEQTSRRCTLWILLW